MDEPVFMKVPKKSLPADVDQVPDAMAELFSAYLELRAGAAAEGIPHDRAVARAVKIAKEWFAFEHF